MMNTDQWDKKDYLAFVLLYLAGTDGVLEPEELRYIAARLGKDHLDHIRAISSDCNDFQCLQIMRELRPRFYPGEIGLASLKMEMHELCTADGRYSQMEERIVDLVAKQL